MSNNANVLLRMEGITKEFPGVKALDGVNLTVKAGTVHALMGENGAGKSTLMKCLFGVYQKNAGKIYLEGREVNFKNSKEALENGVAMVHQELNQALKRSVMDNIWLGRYPKVAGIAVNEKKMYIGKPTVFNPNAPIEQERQRITNYLMESITEIAVNLPEHTVVPYPNVGANQYPKNIPLEVRKK